jgi:hypothetical protein
MTGAMDNDVLYKGACYGLLGDLSTYVDPLPANVFILGVAPYVVRKLIGRGPLQSDRTAAMQGFDKFVATVQLLEPTDREQTLAGSLELTAQRLGLLLHGGESQLCAVAIHRGLSMLLTGDKQAIAAIERLLDADAQLLKIAGRVHCLEQAILAILERDGVAALRTRVCAEPKIDTALTMCFSCFSADPDTNEFSVGLTSYINNMRAGGGRALAP